MGILDPANPFILIILIQTLLCKGPVGGAELALTREAEPSTMDCSTRFCPVV